MDTVLFFSYCRSEEWEKERKKEPICVAWSICFESGGGAVLNLYAVRPLAPMTTSTLLSFSRLPQSCLLLLSPSISPWLYGICANFVLASLHCPGAE